MSRYQKFLDKKQVPTEFIRWIARKTIEDAMDGLSKKGYVKLMKEFPADVTPEDLRLLLRPDGEGKREVYDETMDRDDWTEDIFDAIGDIIDGRL